MSSFPVDRRLLAACIASLSLLVAVKGGRALAVWSDAGIARAALDARELAAARERPRLTGVVRQQILKEREVLNERARSLFPFAEGALADAALARKLEQTASEAGVHIIALHALSSDSTRRGIRALRARVSLTGSLESMMAFLADLRSDTKKLDVLESTFGRADAIMRGPKETIRVDLVVQGVMAPKAPAWAGSGR